ncbi:MAG: CDP-alcohol phosphatidyltransferase family protein [Treponema sp.]|nr:CDP-alcohol phosphatidyltransferase family protein [Treponema sp.]
MKTANAFTLTRIVLAPVFFLIYFIPIWTGRFIAPSAYILIPLLACMEITDFFDGYFARKNHEVSDFGKLFDPFADVVVHLTTFMCFMHTVLSRINTVAAARMWYIPVPIFLLILYREVAQNFLRMVAIKKGTAIAARKGGKLKTVFYVATSFVCLMAECAARLWVCDKNSSGIVTVVMHNFIAWQNGALAMACISLALCYISFVDYLVHFKAVLYDI